MCFQQEMNNAFIRRRKKREWGVGVGWVCERQNWADTALLWRTSRMQREALQKALSKAAPFFSVADKQIQGHRSVCQLPLWIVICAAHLEQTPLILSVFGPLWKPHPTATELYEHLWFFFLNHATRTVQKIHFKMHFKNV